MAGTQRLRRNDPSLIATLAPMSSWELQHGAAAERDPFAQALDMIGVGMAVLDGQSRAVAANAACRRMASDPSGGLSWANGALGAKRREDARALSRALDQARRGMTRALRIFDLNGRTAVEMLLRPLGRAHGDASEVIVVMRAEQAAAPEADLLAQLYELTPAEAGLAEALLTGDGLSRACELRGITVNTGKGYLKRIFEKTGTRRQSELVAMIMNGVAPMGASRSAPRALGETG